MRSKHIPWARVLVEGFVIVFSILLALAADAWWEAGQERREEVQILADLRDEFGTHGSELVGQIEGNERKRSASEDLLFWMAGEREFGRLALDSLWGEVVTTTGFDPASGVYDATVASGRLELVSSRIVRNAVATWPHVVDEVLSSEAGVREIVVSSMVPTLAEAGAPLPAILARSGYDWEAPRSDDVSTMSAYARFRDSARVESLLAYRYSWTTGLLGDLNGAAQAVDDMLTLLEGELADLTGNAF